MANASSTRTEQPAPTLHRSGHERIFAGVAGGLGEHLGISAWWFRWAFIFLALFAGVGVLVYVLAWIVIPGPDEDEPIISGWIQGVDWSDGGAVFGFVLVGVAGILLATQVIHIPSLLVVAVVMFVIGLLLYRGDIKVPERTGTPPPSSGGVVDPPSVVKDTPSGDDTDSTEDVEDAAVVSDGDGSGGDEMIPIDAPPPVPPRRQKPPKPPRERSMLGRLTIAVGLIVVASMALIEASDLAVDIEPFHYFAAIIAILGTSLLIGSWVGRARWLIIIGVIVAPMLWLSMLLPVSWDFSVGEFYHAPATVQEVEATYEQGAGQMTIDLTELSRVELAEVGTIRASLGLGEMDILLPDDVGAVLLVDVTAGEVSGPFRTVSGVGLDVTRRIGQEPTVLVLDLEVGAGVIQVSGPVAVGGDKDVIVNDNGDVIIIEGNN